MKVNEIILRAMENTMTQDGKKYTQTMVADILSERQCKKVSTAAVNDRLKSENMKISTIIEMLDVLGYEVVVKPKSDSDKRESYVVEPGTDRKRVK